MNFGYAGSCSETDSTRQAVMGEPHGWLAGLLAGCLAVSSAARI